MMEYFIGILIGAFVGYSYGWNAAHRTVANECKMLGSFYVGKTVYKCTEVKEQP